MFGKEGEATRPAASCGSVAVPNPVPARGAVSMIWLCSNPPAPSISPVRRGAPVTNQALLTCNLSFRIQERDEMMSEPLKTN